MEPAVETADDFLANYDSDESSQAYRFVPELVPSVISFSCSVFIIQHVTRTRLLMPQSSGGQRTRLKQGNSFPRMIIGMCVFDCISSLTLFVQPLASLLAPTPLVGHWSCSLLGFTKLSGIYCGSVYNALLSTYFFVVVVRNWSEDYVAARFEPFAHAFVGGWMILWIAAIPLEAFNPEQVERTCWPRSYPVGCTSDGVDGTPVCIRGDPWGDIYGIISMAGFLATVFILISNNIAVYCKVRRTERRSRRFQPSLSSSKHNILSTEVRAGGDSRPVGGISPRDKTKEVAVQSFLYCAGYLSTYFLTFLLGLPGMEQNPNNWGKWWFEMLVVLRGVTFPLQGFFNFCTYIRPRYLQWREIQLYRDGVRSRWKAFRGAIIAEPLPDSRAILLMKRSYINRTRQSGREEDGTRIDQNAHDAESSLREEDTAECSSGRSDTLCSKAGAYGERLSSMIERSPASLVSGEVRRTSGQSEPGSPESPTRDNNTMYDVESLVEVQLSPTTEVLEADEAKNNSRLERTPADKHTPLTPSEIAKAISGQSVITTEEKKEPEGDKEPSSARL